ncbi:hypothetical protein RUM43_006889 [Polyplax serrata]|uniref:Uncharacterized protein n=1 Tax=Polyplax serrata TaxID=468196 RepID=A0AAN8PL84_POLSC
MGSRATNRSDVLPVDKSITTKQSAVRVVFYSQGRESSPGAKKSGNLGRVTNEKEHPGRGDLDVERRGILEIVKNEKSESFRFSGGWRAWPGGRGGAPLPVAADNFSRGMKRS